MMRSEYRLYDAQDLVAPVGAPPIGCVLDFWRWAFGNLMEDTLKGLFAEWLVGRLIGLELDLGGRQGGANSDLIMRCGTRVEVKSAAYWQSWKLYTEAGLPIARELIEPRHLARLSKPLQFQVRRTRDSVDRSGTDSLLWSDLYVFAAQFETDPTRWNVLDLAQWRFYCLTRENVAALPQSFPEHRLHAFCSPLPAEHLGSTVLTMAEAMRRSATSSEAEPIRAGV
jgi:hypothetical protein